MLLFRTEVFQTRFEMYHMRFQEGGSTFRILFCSSNICSVVGPSSSSPVCVCVCQMYLITNYTILARQHWNIRTNDLDTGFTCAQRGRMQRARESEHMSEPYPIIRSNKFSWKSVCWDKCYSMRHTFIHRKSNSGWQTGRRSLFHILFILLKSTFIRYFNLKYPMYSFRF